MGKVSAEKLTKDFVSDIIEKIGLKAEVSVSESKDSIEVSINGDNLGALIGFHGETLESLQLIASLFLNNKIEEGEWKRVIVDIGNWRKERANALVSMLENSKLEIEQQKLEKLVLPSMSASQRREVHVIVSEQFPEYATESEGEEPNRRVVLFKKK